MSKRRVVVTGLGAVTPIGNNVKDFWAGIRAGKVGIGPITKFDTIDYKVKIAAEVKDFNAKDHMDPRSARRMDPLKKTRSWSILQQTKYRFSFQRQLSKSVSTCRMPRS